MNAQEIAQNWKHLPTHDYDELEAQIEQYASAQVSKALQQAKDAVHQTWENAPRSMNTGEFANEITAAITAIQKKK